MAYTIKNERNNKQFEQPKPGVYQAVCVRFEDLGMRDGFSPGEKVPKIRLRWELNETDSAGNPYTVVKEYTASLNEKANLRKDLVSWFGSIDEAAVNGEGFDVEALVMGENCQLSVGERTSKAGNVYTVANGIMPLPKGAEKMVASTPADYDDEPPF